MPRFTFSKHERLNSLKEIDLLFREGKSLTSSPIRLIWLESRIKDEALPPIRIMFAAPKKKFSKAVDRNYIKRLMRECYRLGKQDWLEKCGAGRTFTMALVFTGNEVPDYGTIQKALNNALERWLKRITQPTPNT